MNPQCSCCAGYGFRVVRVGWEDPILLLDPIYEEEDCAQCEGTGVAELNLGDGGWL